jgi:hypothetical protein
MPGSFVQQVLVSLRPMVASFPEDLRRIASSDFTVVHATDAERAAEAAATPPIQDARAQDYLAWRLSTLRVTAWLLAASFVVAVVTWIVNLAGSDNNEVLREWVIYMPQFAKVVGGGWLLFVVLQVLVLRERAPGRGARRLRLAWLVSMGLPLLALLIPWGDLMWVGGAPDASRFKEALQDPQQLQRALTGEIMRLLLLVMVLLQALPALLSVFPGLFRAGLTLKTLLPRLGLGPGVAAAAGPLNALYLIVLLVIAQALLTSWALPFVAAFLLGAPMLTGVHCAALSRPMAPEAASRGVQRIRKISRILLGVGALGFVIILGRTSLFSTPMLGWSEAMVGPFDVLNLLVNLGGMVLTFTVVSSDGILVVSPARPGATGEDAADHATVAELKGALVAPARPSAPGTDAAPA